MRDTELQVVDDALHGMIGLLPGGTEVLLHGPGHGGKDGLGSLPGVHQLPRVFGGRCSLFILVTPDVGEGFLYCHHQSGRRHRTVNET